MSTLTIPNTFVNGTTINAAPFNANFGAIVTWSLAIDNTNIGVAGLFPSQLLPTTAAQATFGATATGVGYKFLANDATAVPLTISGISGQTADIFDVTLTSSGTKAFGISSYGTILFNGNIPDPGIPNAPCMGSFSAGQEMFINMNNSGATNFFFTTGATGSGFAPVTGGAYTNASDATLKTNVAPITGALATLAQLKPSSYNWIDSGLPDFGFVAQDVQPVLPQLIRTNSRNPLLGLVYTGITALNSAAINELAAQFQAYVAAHP